jgi:hypothetical protein
MRDAGRFTQQKCWAERDGMNNRKRDGSQKCGVAPVKAESFEKDNSHESRYLIQDETLWIQVNGTDGGINL